MAEPITSPTFAIFNVHRGARRTLVHLDAYRLAGPAQLDALALLYRIRKAGGPDNAAQVLLRKKTKRKNLGRPVSLVTFKTFESFWKAVQARRFDVVPIGQRYVPVVARLAQRFQRHG